MTIAPSKIYEKLAHELMSNFAVKGLSVRGMTKEWIAYKHILNYATI